MTKSRRKVKHFPPRACCETQPAPAAVVQLQGASSQHFLPQTTSESLELIRYFS